jgi:hypothetical protein
VRALAKRLDALVSEWRPDQLHAHSPVLSALAALGVARRRRVPLVYEIRAFWEMPPSATEPAQRVPPATG